jgi:hypothetical protein
MPVGIIRSLFRSSVSICVIRVRSHWRLIVETRVIAEEIVTHFVSPGNGSGPLWCYGSPAIARDGARVFASVPETAPDVPPLCNTRWRLFSRQDGEPGGFRLFAAGDRVDEREPCPVARQSDGRILLSVNPAVEHLATWSTGRSYRCEPRLLAFDAAGRQSPAALDPAWNRPYRFTEHSYRGLSIDGRTGQALALNIDGHEGQAWSFLDADGRWPAQGMIRFPLRGCYPQAALRGRAAWVMAVSDVVEPNEEWRAHKRQVTGNDWDYDFRQLYFTWTPDVTAAPFSPILTVASVDETCGHIRNLDLWIGPDGDAHLLWLERSVWHAFMRDRFFPGLPITVALKHCRIRHGEVIQRSVLLRRNEDEAIGLRPTCAAFHALDDRTACVICHAEDPASPAGGGMFAQLVFPEPGPPVRIAARHPLHTFFAAGPRNGCAPSGTADLLGIGAEPDAVRYAQLRLRL